MRAPKPTQVLLTSDDTCFPAEGGRTAIAEARAAFKALGNISALESNEAIWHHGYVQPNREKVYQFFCNQLAGTDAEWHKNCSQSQELAVPELHPDELQITSTGQVQTAPECQSLSVWNFTAELTRSNLKRVEQERTEDSHGFIAKVSMLSIHHQKSKLNDLFFCPAYICYSCQIWHTTLAVIGQYHISHRGF